MAVTKTNKARRSSKANGLSTSTGAGQNSKAGRKPTEKEVQDALAWAEGFQARHSDLFDRLAQE
ncbi:hypothetical protein [Salinibacter sp.]|uniref:hypothetical protein n=1 Tax=Salinibacter sp. TaxID=2065818 RepID=UPI0021E92F77|nr:hypothetical protein [Salinibacter sp.]